MKVPGSILIITENQNVRSKMEFAGMCASFPPFFPLEGGTEVQVMDTHKG